jgi:integrase/recombinase XerD
MPYQFKREPLTQDEANRLAQACSTHLEKLVALTLLDTGLRVSELAELTKDNLDWQMHRLMIYGKGGPYEPNLSDASFPYRLASSRLEGHLALHDSFGISARTIQRLIKSVANKASISRPVSPHVLRHTFAVTAVQKGYLTPLLAKAVGP